VAKRKRPDREKARLAERDLPRVADQDVLAHDADRVERHERGDEHHVVRRHPRERGDRQEQEAEERPREGPAREAQVLGVGLD